MFYFLFQVNELAGGSHSENSYHYYGSASDFQIRAGDAYETWMAECAAHGAVENLGPPTPNHETHTHCAFPA